MIPVQRERREMLGGWGARGSEGKDGGDGDMKQETERNILSICQFIVLHIRTVF